MQAYCVKCKKKVEVTNNREEIMKTSKGKRKFLKGNCAKCGTKVSRVIGGAE